MTGRGRSSLDKESKSYTNSTRCTLLWPYNAFTEPLPQRRQGFLVDVAGIAKAKTAGVYLSQLEEKGLLKGFELGREKLYLNRALLQILEK